MLDTLNITYNYDKNTYTSKSIASNFIKVDTIHRHTGQTSYTAHDCKPFKIHIGDNRIKIYGSMTKYVLGDNFNTLSRQDIKKGVEKLCDCTNLPIDDFTVSRTDISTNFIVDYPPPLYYDYLGQDIYSTWKREPHFTDKGSLYYNNTYRTKLFYDKTNWAKQNGILIPVQYQDKNILRFENRLNNQFVNSTVLGLETTYVKHIYQEEYYIKLIDEWYKQYQTIEKIRNVKLKLKTDMKESEVQQLFIANFLNIIGEDEYSKILYELKSRKVFKHPSQYTRLKNNLQNIREKHSEDVNPLMDELDYKIGNVEYYYS